jgi:hypothetical protein
MRSWNLSSTILIIIIIIVLHYVSQAAQSVQSLATGCVQTDSGAHPASCTMGTGGPFPGGKEWPESDADHSPPSSAEVEYEQELYTSSTAKRLRSV